MSIIVHIWMFIVANENVEGGKSIALMTNLKGSIFSA